MKLRELPILMIFTILAIAGFQIFWLSENYKKEKRDLELRANILFREAIFRLQGSKMKFDGSLSNTENFHFEMSAEKTPMRVRVKSMPDAEVAAMVNTIGTKIRDSLKLGMKQNVVIMKNSDLMIRNDSTNSYRMPGHPGDKMIQLLYGVDSLQEPLTIKEIDSSYQFLLDKARIDVPYTITQSTVTGFNERPDPEEFNKVRVGIAKPVMYELHLGNSFTYIMKRLASPILFSFFLVGVTIVSFLLLYRNLRHQKKLTAIKNEFISNITHELKTPIATVGVAIEALRNFNAINDPQRSKEYLDISQNELHRLSLLVDKVLKLSMFEKKEIDIHFENVNMKDIVDEVVSSMRLQVEKHNAQVDVVSEGDVTLQGDKLHLLSIVFNLLDNALKYSKGQPSIQMHIAGSDDKVIFSIRDNGIGISPEYHDRLFEKFFRVPTGNTHNAKGYGLGLSYVAHVVERHKGSINVKSEPGVGSVFSITLPKNQA